MKTNDIGRMVIAGIRAPFVVKNWPAYYLMYARKYIPALARVLPADPIVRLRNGVSFRLKPLSWDRIYILTEVWLLHDYDLSGNDYGPGQTVIDIGAHIGSLSIYAATHGANVYAYEPFLPSYELLQDNIRLNNLDKRIKPYRLALAATRGEQTFYSDPTNAGANSLVLKTKHQHKVKTITLADIFTHNKIRHCHILKCDIEGAEYELFYTAPSELFQEIDRIYIEWHLLDQDPTHRPEALQAFLEKMGYVVQRRFTCLYATKSG